MWYHLLDGRGFGVWPGYRLACCVTCVYAIVGLCRRSVPKARWGLWRVTTKSCGIVGMFAFAIDTIEGIEGACSTLHR